MVTLSRHARSETCDCRGRSRAEVDFRAAGANTVAALYGAATRKAVPGCEAVQRGGVVVCWRKCRSIDMEGGLGVSTGLFWEGDSVEGGSSEGAYTTHGREETAADRDTRGLATIYLRKRVASSRGYTQTFDDLLRFAWQDEHQTSFVWGALPAH